jgi:hypothetical protein
MGSAKVQGQVNTVNLSGTVLDPSGGAVQGAKLTATSAATGVSRSATTNANGRYEIIGLPPGGYSLGVESSGFATLTNPALTLVLGTNAEYNPQLALKSTAQTVTVEARTELVETSKTEVSQSITANQINNLPINRRDYINFALLTPQSARDDTPSIGAAPTSGLNFGGQRARSNEISVDGADAVNNSVNGVRATVSQEAVQEFQVITSNYMPEYGRAMGGVVNIVTKSGSNELHGNVFGYLRLAALQARNPFSVDGSFNPATDSVELTPVKQSFTRVQSGATLGGPIQKNKTFFFFAYETIRSEATGFTNIGENNFGLVPSVVPCFPSPLLLTSTQAAYFTGAINTQTGNNPANCSPALPDVQAAGLAGASSAVALFGNTQYYPGATFPTSGAPLPASYTGLITLLGNYPTKEDTNLWSLKFDHIWNNKNTSFIRASLAPSFISGIQVNAENQNFGQNAGNRTSLQDSHDFDLAGQHTTAIRDNLFNEFRIQYARRSLHYGYSNLPGGDDPAVNITGYAFFGREPFSTENLVERRFQWTDNLTWTKGSHTLKFGGDVNLIQNRAIGSQLFELNYGGVYTFSSFTNPADGNAAATLSPVQSYGAGLPQEFIQGIGNSNRPSDNKTLGVFAQDSWKINRRLTMNYGVRYDIEWTPNFAAANSINATGEQLFNVTQGIPVDKNNVAPRLALAWDPRGDGKTVIRVGYGIFYDHPPIALAFLANAFDGAQSTLLETGPGAPSSADVSNPLNFGALNASSIFQGVLSGAITGCSTSAPSMCYEPSQQRFNPLFANSFFTNDNFLKFQTPYGSGYPLPFLPFTIPVEKDFKYAYAQQGNLTIEREVAKNLKVSAAYSYTHGLHLDHTQNLSTTNPALLTANDNNAIQSGLDPAGTSPLAIVNIPGTAGCQPTAGGGSVNVIAPTILGVAYPVGNIGCAGAPLGYVSAPVVFNYFRRQGPNPSFGGIIPGGYNTLVGLAQLAGYPMGFPGAEIPWSDVNPQVSSGNSIYNALTISVNKRFSNHFELLSGYTWSHAIDDSTDLSTLLNPQDNNFPDLERSSSDFDQRHRWITSAVFLSSDAKTGDGMWRKIFGGFTVAPIIEVASGRPYNVLIGYDTNLDFGTATNRPSVIAAGTQVPPGFPVPTTSPYIKGAQFIVPTRCVDATGASFGPYPDVPTPPTGCTGDLGRNAFTRPGYFDVDLRISRRFAINERWNVEVIGDGFNILNRFNVGDVNPLCDPTAGSPTCLAGQPTAALDPRTFQFALKVNW